MWTPENRCHYNRDHLRYPSDLTDAEWALVETKKPSLTTGPVFRGQLIYKQTGNLRAVQNLLGHTKIETPVRYLGADVEDALRLTETT